MIAWNGWYHVNGGTYGTWLPGDPRGWREKHHKRHVEGDYRNPPPAGSGAALHDFARGMLKCPPVHLDAERREIAGRALVEMLVMQEIEVLALCVDAVHFHLLARFPDGKVRPCVGRAKKHAYHCLRDRRHVGKLWGRLCHVKPVSDRSHQVKVFNYIRNHENKRAWVRTFRQGVYWRKEVPR